MPLQAHAHDQQASQLSMVNMIKHIITTRMEEHLIGVRDHLYWDGGTIKVVGG